MGGDFSVGFKPYTAPTTPAKGVEPKTVKVDLKTTSDEASVKKLLDASVKDLADTDVVNIYGKGKDGFSVEKVTVSGKEFKALAANIKKQLNTSDNFDLLKPPSFMLTKDAKGNTTKVDMSFDVSDGKGDNPKIVGGDKFKGAVDVVSKYDPQKHAMLDLTTGNSLTSSETFEAALKAELAKGKSDLLFKVKLEGEDGDPKEVVISYNQLKANNIDKGVLNYIRHSINNLGTTTETGFVREKLTHVRFQFPLKDGDQGGLIPKLIVKQPPPKTTVQETDILELRNKGVGDAKTVEDHPMFKRCQDDVNTWTGKTLTAAVGFNLTSSTTGLRTMFDKYLEEGGFDKAKYKTDSEYKEKVLAGIETMISKTKDGGTNSDGLKSALDSLTTILSNDYTPKLSTDSTAKDLSAAFCKILFEDDAASLNSDDVKVIQATFYAMSQTREDYVAIQNLQSGKTDEKTKNNGIDGIPAIRFSIVTRTLMIDASEACNVKVKQDHIDDGSSKKREVALHWSDFTAASKIK